MSISFDTARPTCQATSCSSIDSSVILATYALAVSAWIRVSAKLELRKIVMKGSCDVPLICPLLIKPLIDGGVKI